MSEGFTLEAVSEFIEEFKRQIATPELPELGPGPRGNVQSQGALNRLIDSFVEKAKLSTESDELVRSLVLLWHDHLDAAHQIAQNIENADGSFVHGILHRREPDYSNAKYWFHRVGKHPCFPELAAKVSAPPCSNQGTKLAEKLVPNGEWDSIGFIDACEEASERPLSDPQRQWLREIQRIEFDVLLRSFCGHS